MSSKVGILCHKQKVKIVMLMTVLALKLSVETDSVLLQEMLTGEENFILDKS